MIEFQYSGTELKKCFSLVREKLEKQLSDNIALLNKNEEYLSQCTLLHTSLTTYVHLNIKNVKNKINSLKYEINLYRFYEQGICDSEIYKLSKQDIELFKLVT